MASIEERVAKGATLLDQKWPGWEKLVHSAGPLTGYDMGRAYGAIGKCGCVLGRIGGSYTAGGDELFGCTRWWDRMTEGGDAYDHGFIGYEGDPYDEYPELASAWTAEVNKRLEAGGA